MRLSRQEYWSGFSSVQLLSCVRIFATPNGMGCHPLFQRIFLTQGSNQGLLHCRQMERTRIGSRAPSTSKSISKFSINGTQVSPFKHLLERLNECRYYHFYFSNTLSSESLSGLLRIGGWQAWVSNSGLSDPKQGLRVGAGGDGTGFGAGLPWPRIWVLLLSS